MQVLQNDLAKELCPAERLVCLVVDECHKATGDAAIVCAIRSIYARRASALRIIGLSATPGSDCEKIQEVISNVRASRVMFFGEEDPEVKKYRHGRVCERIVVESTGAVQRCEDALKVVQNELLSRLERAGLIDTTTSTTSAFTITNQYRSRTSAGARCVSRR